MIASSSPIEREGDRVDFDAARAAMLAAAEPLPPERVALADADGRIVAAVLRAEDDIVPYARSSMDGFALRAADTQPGSHGADIVLSVSGALYAGERPASLAPGAAMAIATGAPLPAGADAVVPIEHVTRRAATIVLSASLHAGEHVFAAGDDAERGELLAECGDAVTPGRAALLAAAGFGTLPVHRRPRVAIVCTGDELVAVDEHPQPGQIRNSNAAMLGAHLARDGAEIVLIARAADTAHALRASLRHALDVSDLVITTGGASVGERDLVKGILAELGAHFAFRSVALRPAKPTAFARCSDALVAVLPGNPAAAYVAYAMLVRGVVRRLGGHRRPNPTRISAMLDGFVRAKPQRHFVAFGRLVYERERFRVSPLGNQCSSLVRTSADATAFIIVPPGEARYATGDSVAVDVIDWNAVTFSTS